MDVANGLDREASTSSLGPCSLEVDFSSPVSYFTRLLFFRAERLFSRKTQRSVHLPHLVRSLMCTTLNRKSS